MVGDIFRTNLLLYEGNLADVCHLIASLRPMDDNLKTFSVVSNSICLCIFFSSVSYHSAPFSNLLSVIPNDATRR